MRKIGVALGKTTQGTKNLLHASVKQSKKGVNTTKNAMKNAKSEFIEGFKDATQTRVVKPGEVLEGDILEDDTDEMA
jgi:hypothetical protein